MKIETLQLGQAVLTVYLREPSASMPQAAARPLVLVVPGGGYEHVSDREGDPVAVRFLAEGYHAAVLRYSVGEGARGWRPLAEINDALAAVRARAADWGVCPDKVAVCGFSAGGHLALSSAVLDLPGLPAGQAQQRPDALILGYPVVTAGDCAHRGSFVRLTGDDDRAAHCAFSLEDKIRPGVPPVFVWHTMEDGAVPVENTLMLISALHRAQVPCEAHLFPQGRHGLSVCTAEVGNELPHPGRWFELAAEWLSQQFQYHP